MAQLGLLIPTVDEADCILANAIYRWKAAGVGTYHSSTYPVILAITGTGKVFTAHGAASLANQVQLMLSLGTSGSLTRDPIGSIRYAFEFVERDMDAAGLGFPPGVTPHSEMLSPIMTPCPRALANRIRDILNTFPLDIAEARCASGDSFVVSTAFGAGVSAEFGATIVDMETAAAAKLCQYRYDLPFFAVRWIANDANYAASSALTVHMQEAARDLDKVVQQLILGGLLDCIQDYSRT